MSIDLKTRQVVAWKETKPMTIVRAIAVMAALSLGATTALAGSESRLGTGGASELRIAVGARSVALGGAHVGSVTGPEALFYNPAGIAWSDDESSTQVMFSYNRWIADIDRNYVAVIQRMGSSGTLGVSVNVLSVGEMERTTEAAPDGTGEVFSPTFATLGLTYARQLTDRVSFGGTAHYVAERILQETAAGVAFDFGFQYDTDYRGLRLGFAMKNFGPNLEYRGSDFGRISRVPGDDPNAFGHDLSLSAAAFELPSSFEFGMSYPAWRGPQGSLGLHGLYTSNSFNVDEGRFGAEFLYKQDFALRAGYKYTTNDEDLFGMSYGAGVRVPLGGSHLWVDYAGQTVSDFFDDAQHVTLTMQF
jgi:hypothetical protein